MKAMVISCGIALLSICSGAISDTTDDALKLLTAKPDAVSKMQSDSSGFVDKTDMKGLVIRQSKDGTKMIGITKMFFKLHPELDRVSIAISPDDKVKVTRYPNEIMFTVYYK